MAWCAKSNLIACAASTSVADDSRERLDSPFSIAVHLVDPSYPTEHTVLHAPSGSPSAIVQILSWSPLSCQQALLAVDSSGSGAIWAKPTFVAPNVAKSAHTWQLESTWHLEPLVVAKWLAGPLPYRLPGASGQQGTPLSYEERYLAREPPSATRWPLGGFLCLCSVSAAGAVQLRWRQAAPSMSAPGQAGPATWHASLPLQLNCGVGGIAAADVIVTGAGSLVVAAVSQCQPSTVVLWEVTPPPDSAPGRPASSATRQVSTGRDPIPTLYSGTSPLVAHLQAWEARPADASEGLQLSSSVLSSFSVSAGSEVDGKAPGSEGGSGANSATPVADGASRVVAVTFDPSTPGSAIVTVTTDGGKDSDKKWTAQRWESSRRQVSLHPMFDSLPPASMTTPPLPPPASPTLPFTTNWTALASASLPPLPPNTPPTPPTPPITPKWVIPPESCGAKRRRVKVVPSHPPLERENDCCSTSVLAGFSTTGQEVFVSLAERRGRGGSKVEVLHGGSLARIARLGADEGRDPDGQGWGCERWMGGGEAKGREGGSQLPCALSPTGCAVAMLTEGEVDGHCLLRVIWAPLYKGLASLGDSPAPDSATQVARGWERQLAERIEWSLLVVASHWDAIAACHCAADDGIGTVAGLANALDVNFDGLPGVAHRQHYSTALDRVKARLLEGGEGGEKCRAVLLDIQARLLLDFLHTSARALLVNPQALPKQPWASKDNGQTADLILVHPPLISTAHNYADTILDLALYFLTRLRRLAAFVRASLLQGGSGNAAGQVAVQLISDRNFLQRLGQLTYFAIAICRRNAPLPPPLPPNTGPATGIHHALSSYASALRDDPSGARPLRLGNGNGGQGYTTEEARTIYFAMADLIKKTEKCDLIKKNPTTQSPAASLEVRLHYPDGQINIPADFFGPNHMHHSKMPRPRGADAAGVLTRELELHPPSEDWSHWEEWSPFPFHLRSPNGGKEEEEEVEVGARLGEGSGLWPRRRRTTERDVAMGLKTAAGMGDLLGFMGCRRDVIMSSWRTMPEHMWHKCTSCGRQTAALALTGAPPNFDSGDPMALWQILWASRWNQECPICGGRWIRVA